jgi:nitroimidazol reductase NimA-like FMN-containing flavoprotein (pyridoxamine 5'-phosphate oxidase superfamily)
MNEPMELSVQESLDRLSSEVLGRLAFTTPRGPRIVPLNYTLVDDSLVFRTSAHGEIARFAIDKLAAFEIDRIDHDAQTGWSVVASGIVEELEPAGLADLRNTSVSQPWAGGVRNLYLRLTWRELTGRRLHDCLAQSPKASV